MINKAHVVKVPNWKQDEVKEAINLYFANLVTCIGLSEARKLIEEELELWPVEINGKLNV